MIIFVYSMSVLLELIAKDIIHLGVGAMMTVQWMEISSGNQMTPSESQHTLKMTWTSDTRSLEREKPNQASQTL